MSENPYQTPSTRSNGPDTKWAQWEKTRSKGRQRYIWVFGVLAWGIPTGVLWSIFVCTFVWDWEKIWYTLPWLLVAFPIGGYFGAKYTWAKIEMAYNRDMADGNDD